MPRVLQSAEGDRCFCDVDFVEEARPPTKEEFSDALSDAISDSEQLNFTSTGVTEALTTQAPATSAPVTSAPITPAPVTPESTTTVPVTLAPTTAAPATDTPVTAAPMTAAPVTTAPTTSAPTTPAPITTAPTTSAPTTPAPVTTAPTTSAPTTPAPVTPQPTTASPVSPRPTVATTLTFDVEYDIALINSNDGRYAADLVAAMDLLATQVASQTFVRARRRLTVTVQTPTSLKDVLETDCPELVALSDTCLQVVHTIVVEGDGVDASFDIDQFRDDLAQAILGGQLQPFLDAVNLESPIYIATGLTSSSPIVLPVTTPAPVAPTNAPVAPQPVTPAPVTPTGVPVSPAPVVVEGTNERQICEVDPATEKVVCTCRSGFTGNDCFDDIDECIEAGVCAFEGSFCVNKAGNDGMYSCGCNPNTGWVNVEGQFDDHGSTFCQRANPCEQDPSPCDMNADCIYFSGPLEFDCICKSNFEGDGFTGCQPGPTQAPTMPPTTPPTEQPTIATCANNGVICPTGHTCDESGTEARCVCMPGYSSLNEGISACNDDDECSDPAVHGCHADAACDNRPGTFVCTCNSGFIDAPGSTRSGTSCILLNERSDPVLNSCELSTQVCVDRAPFANFECVPITPSPTSPPHSPPTDPPTPPPTNPAPPPPQSTTPPPPPPQTSSSTSSNSTTTGPETTSETTTPPPPQTSSTSNSTTAGPETTSDSTTPPPPPQTSSSSNATTTGPETTSESTITQTSSSTSSSITSGPCTYL